jgi:hypothetical protein
MTTETIPPPLTVADRLRQIPVGGNAWFAVDDIPPATIRSTITRIKTGAETNYTTRPHGRGLMVWRLA